MNSTPNTAALSLQPGKEQYEEFYSIILGKYMLQYDYRHNDGTLFSTVARDLETARRRRDAWINRKGQNS